MPVQLCGGLLKAIESKRKIGAFGMSAPTVAVATDYPPVRVRRAPRLEPPFDDEDDPTWSPAVPAGHVAAGAGAIGVLAQPGRGPRTQRPVTPRPPRGPAEIAGAVLIGAAEGSPAHPGTGTAHAGTTHAGTAQSGTGQPGTAQPGTAPHCAGRGGAVGGAQHAVGVTQATAGPEPGFGRRHPSPGAMAAQRFVGVCVEILNGHRAVSHLRAVTAPGDLKQVTDQLVGRTNRTYLGRQGRTVATPSRVRLLGMRTCEPRDGVIEAAVVLGYGIHTWAMAVRMERPADVWLCKLVQVV